jgi:hypothetical protein
MKHFLLALSVILVAGCAGMGDGRSVQTSGGMSATSDAGGMHASARNLCEAMRNFEQYNPDDCRGR